MKRSKSDAAVPSARDFMRKKVFTFSPEEEIADAVSRLLARGFSGAPVVDGAGALVGVLSEWDCARVLSEAAYERWPTGTVKEHMTTDVELIAPTTDLFTILGKFSEGGHRRFPVVEGGRLVGLVTRRDLLDALYRHARARRRPESTYELIEKQRGE
ncbi:MAG TPA: CBS domain-containing protein [Thermoanaerobaculia bacterium]|nr:CBS domain-containing protein [Thermoanaerobaculia bacterium]